MRIWRVLPLVALVLAGASMFLSALLYGRSVDTTNRIEAETTERRDQACRGYEAVYRNEVKELGNTYDFFLHPPKEFEGLLKDPRVIQSLRDSERDARSDADGYGQFVPPACDDPGIGLPEPDPVAPPRPKELR